MLVFSVPQFRWKAAGMDGAAERIICIRTNNGPFSKNCTTNTIPTTIKRDSDAIKPRWYAELVMKYIPCQPQHNSLLGATSGMEPSWNRAAANASLS